jgi:hypothetical protein
MARHRAGHFAVAIALNCLYVDQTDNIGSGTIAAPASPTLYTVPCSAPSPSSGDAGKLNEEVAEIGSVFLEVQLTKT